MSHVYAVRLFAAYPGAAPERDVLTALALHMSYRNPAQPVRPSVETLAKLSGYTGRRVRTALRNLESEGWITAVGSRRGGPKQTVAYRINIEILDRYPDRTKPDKATPDVGLDDQNPVPRTALLSGIPTPGTGLRAEIANGNPEPRSGLSTINAEPRSGLATTQPGTKRPLTRNQTTANPEPGSAELGFELGFEHGTPAVDLTPNVAREQPGNPSVFLENENRNTKPDHCDVPSMNDLAGLERFARNLGIETIGQDARTVWMRCVAAQKSANAVRRAQSNGDGSDPTKPPRP